MTSTQRWTLAVVCAATAMLMLDIAVVNTALSDIAADLNTGLSGLQWVVDAYTLALAAVVLTAGSLADRFGRRRLFMIGLSIFTVTSLVCAAASDIVMLNSARAAQGIGAAIMFAVSLALLSQAFPKPAGARQGVRRLRRFHRRRLRHRPAGRRRAHQRPRLALDLHRQPPARPHVPGDHAPLRRGVARPGRPQARHSRPGHADRRPVPARARAAARQRGRLDEHPDRRRAGRRRRLPRRLHRRRGARQGADAPARAVPQPRLHRRAGRGVRHLRVVLRRVPLHDDLPAADPRAVGDRGRARLPARHADHARRLRRDRELRREDRRRSHDRRRPADRRHRPGAADARRGRLVVDGVPPRRDRRLHRQRASSTRPSAPAR